MGYYLGQRQNPCPRCGGTVLTSTSEFTPDEEKALGPNVRRTPMTQELRSLVPYR